MKSSTKASEINGQIFSMGSLLTYLAKIKDMRKPRGIRYSLVTILVVMVLAKLCGEDKPYGIADWAQMRSEWLIETLNLEYKRLPHHSTYRRVLSEVVDGDEFEALISAYLGSLPQDGQEVVLSMDGKTVRGTITAEDPFGLHLLAAYLPDEGIVLLQMVVEKDKENEIVVAPKLLKSLDLRKKIVIGDAMHTQRKLSTQIVDAGGDYVWLVKDNQPNTRQAIAQLFAPEKPIPGVGCPPMDSKQPINLGDGLKNAPLPSAICSMIIWTGLIWRKFSNWNAASPILLQAKSMLKFNMASPVSLITKHPPNAYLKLSAVNGALKMVCTIVEM